MLPSGGDVFLRYWMIPKGVYMPAVAIVGVQWGDEGKGKIVDLLADSASMVVRYQGGSNAGHTVVVGDRVIKLHQVPSGVIHAGVRPVLGNGMVIQLLCSGVCLSRCRR